MIRVITSLVIVLQTSITVAAEFYFPVGNPDYRPQQPGKQNNNGFYITRKFNWEGHTGIDLSDNSEGGEVRAITDGTVVIICKAGDSANQNECSGFGNVILIKHDLSDGTYYSLYAHLKQGSILVENGHVDAGDKIAEVNCTGYTISSQGNGFCESNGGTGSHLH